MQHEAFFTFQVEPRRNGETEEQYLCAFNQRAMRVVTQLTGKDPVAYLIDQAGGLERTQLLSYACTETFRRGNNYQISWDDWLDGPYLGVYGSEYWANLASFIEDLVVKTFPWVVELRDLIRGAATKNENRSDQNQSIGTPDITMQSSQVSSKTRRNSGTAGTTRT